MSKERKIIKVPIPKEIWDADMSLCNIINRTPRPFTRQQLTLSSIMNIICEIKEYRQPEQEDIYRLPTNYLLCYLNGFLDVIEQLYKAKNFIRDLEDKTTYIKYKEAMRVIRKVKYN